MADAQSIVIKAQAAVDEAVAASASPAVLAKAQDCLAEAQSYAAPPASFPTIAGTQLTTLCKARPVGYGGAGEGAQAPSSDIGPITVAWNGAAFDYGNKVMYIPVPGGDGDRYQNESFAIQVPDGPSWRLHEQTYFPPDRHIPGVYEPVDQSGNPTPGNGYSTPTGTFPVNPYVNGARVYYDGKPPSRHTYWGCVYLPTQHKIWTWTGAPWRGGSDGYSGFLDPSTGTWTRKANVNNMNGATSAYDAMRDQVVWTRNGIHDVRYYNPATDVHVSQVRAADSFGSGQGPFCSIQIDPIGDYVYAINRWGFGTWIPGCNLVRMKLGQPTVAKTWTNVPITGDFTALRCISPGFEYDPDRHAFVIWAYEDPTNVTVVPLDTFVCYKVPIAWNGSWSINGTVNGVFGRFRRYDVNKYCVLTSANQPLRLFDVIG